jgi:hypothetical protein
MKPSRTLALVGPALLTCSLLSPRPAESASMDGAAAETTSEPGDIGVIHTDIDPVVPNAIDPCWYIATDLYELAQANANLRAQFKFIYVSDGKSVTRIVSLAVKDGHIANHDHGLGPDFVVFSDSFVVDLRPDPGTSIQTFVELVE